MDHREKEFGQSSLVLGKLHKHMVSNGIHDICAAGILCDCRAVLIRDSQLSKERVLSPHNQEHLGW